jgi:hypothetical protein
MLRDDLVRIQCQDQRDYFRITDREPGRFLPVQGCRVHLPYLISWDYDGLWMGDLSGNFPTGDK